MAILKIDIDSENSAFSTPENAANELIRILESVQKNIATMTETLNSLWISESLFDINGNNVGSVFISLENESEDE